MGQIGNRWLWNGNFSVGYGDMKSLVVKGVRSQDSYTGNFVILLVSRLNWVSTFFVHMRKKQEDSFFPARSDYIKSTNVRCTLYY